LPFFHWTRDPMRRNVQIMKMKNLFALFITITVLLSGCGKTNTKLQSENADLKARPQKPEQQLQESKSQTASPASQTASTQDLKSQLDEAQKKAEAAANELQSVSSQVETQKEIIVNLTRQLSDCQQAGEKAEKALELYRDQTAAAIKEFQALRTTLGDQTAKFDGYHQNYLATQAAVTKLTDALPECKVRWHIEAVLSIFTHIDGIWVTADRQMQARTWEAKAAYDKFVGFGGLGPNDYVVKMGKDTILAPAAQKNAVTASSRDQDIVSMEKDLDAGLKNLQALVSGQRT
jgi:predicted  nucleic acid-binding Zn-ribbon protein